MPVSGAAGGCLPARGCFRRRQPLHAAQYAGSRRRCVGRSRASQRHGAQVQRAELRHRRTVASLLCASAFASLLYTPPVYTNCSNCCFASVGGSCIGPPRAAMTARRAAQQAAFCFFVRPRRRVAGVKRAAGRADEGRLGGGGGGGGRGGGVASRAFLAGCFIPRAFVESAHFLLILWAGSSTWCGWLTTSAQLVAGRPARLHFPQHLRLLPPCER